jgi:hypothetical protein
MKYKKYAKESELRFINCDVYDSDSDEMGGRILAGKKDALGYRGRKYTYADNGLQLLDIAIGENCSEAQKSTLLALRGNLFADLLSEKVVQL